MDPSNQGAKDKRRLVGSLASSLTTLYLSMRRRGKRKLPVIWGAELVWQRTMYTCVSAMLYWYSCYCLLVILVPGQQALGWN
jgi:hypothetical protein